MNIEIRDSALQARIQKQLEQTGSANVRSCWPACWRHRRSRAVGFLRTGQPLMPRSAVGWLSSIAVKEFLKTNWTRG